MNIESEVSDLKSEISNFKSQISSRKSAIGNRHSAIATRRGVALTLVLLALALAVILGAGFLASSSTASQISKGADDYLKARLIAESALDMAVAYIDSDPNWRDNRDNGVWVASQSLAGGSFVLLGEDGAEINAQGQVVGSGSLTGDPLRPVTLTAVGIYGRARAPLRLTIWPVPASTVAVSDRIIVGGQSVIDSYSAAHGTGSGGHGSRAVLSTNAIAMPNVTLRDSARVNGNVYIGPGGSPAAAVQVLDSAQVTGTLDALPAEVPMPVLNLPTMPASIGSQSYSSGTTIINSDTHFSDLTIGGNGVLRVVGDVNILVSGDFRMHGNGMIDVGTSGIVAAALKGQAEVLDDAVVDSYNSAVGYAASAGSDAMVATNATSSGIVTVEKGTIKGDAYSGVGSNPSSAIQTKSGGTITGSTEALEDSMTIPAPPPNPTDVGSNLGDWQRSSGTHTISGNMRVGSFKIVSSAAVRISGDIVIRADKEFVVDDTAKLEILPDSSLTIYVAHYFKASANAQVNTNTQDPSKLVIYGRGSDYEHTILNNAQVHAIIDSPNSDLTISDDARFFGAFMGRDMLVKVRGKFHQDHSPATAAVAEGRFPATSGGTLTLYTQGGFLIEDNATVNAISGDPARVTFAHLPSGTTTIKGTGYTVATLLAPDATADIAGSVRYTGWIRARDLAVAGSAAIDAVASGGTSNPGVLVTETIELSGTATLNGIGGSAILASNSRGAVAISLRDSAILSGDAYCGPGGDVNTAIGVRDSAAITGLRAPLAQPVNIAMPAGPSMWPPYPDQTYSGTDNITISSDVYADNFEIRDNAIVEIDGDVTIALTGGLLLGNQGQLRLRPGARVTVFCDGPVRVRDEAVINPDGNPFQVVVNCGANQIDISNGARVFASITAPAAELSITDTAALYGSYLGRQLRLSADARVYYTVAGIAATRWREE